MATKKAPAKKTVMPPVTKKFVVYDPNCFCSPRIVTACTVADAALEYVADAALEYVEDEDNDHTTRFHIVELNDSNLYDVNYDVKTTCTVTPVKKVNK